MNFREVTLLMIGRVGFAGQNGVHLPRHHRGIDERQPGAVAREEIAPRLRER